jgi:hypothetical protein
MIVFAVAVRAASLASASLRSSVRRLRSMKSSLRLCHPILSFDACFAEMPRSTQRATMISLALAAAS